MLNPAFDYIQFFGELVDNIRLRGLVISIEETPLGSGLYTCELSDYNGVEVGRLVDLGVDGLNDAKIIEIPTDGQMIVQGVKNVDVTNVEKYIRLDPFFYKDRGNKIIEAILSKNNSYFKEKMFPSVELVLDNVTFDDSVDNYSTWENIRIIFCEKTDQTDTAEEKDIDTFKPTLRPNYARLKDQIERSKFIVSKDATFKRREYYGELYTNDKSKYAKPFYVDALVMEITNLKLTNTNEICINLNDY